MTEPNGNVIAVTAAADVAGQRFIAYNGNYPSAGELALGVSKLSTSSGQQVPVQVTGVVEVLAGGAIAVGGPVKVTTSGKALAQGGTGVIVGRALTASNGDGESIQVLLLPS